MSEGSQLDIRWPIGLLFLAMGLLLAGYGALAEQALRPLGWNLNLWWGIVMAVFGLVMMAGALRGSKRD